ncbi:MAG: S1 RNA-binding domain-containing protein [Patescibacteria group bacterium]|nr:S1 RNA-binding domain-containing protein [Patescibacteria group bacterium]
MNTLAEPTKEVSMGVMDLLLRKEPALRPRINELIEGKVIGKEQSSIFVDITPFGTGIIYGREFNNARDIIKILKPGDSISAKVVEIENEDGYIELSLKEAKQEKIWAEVEETQKSNIALNLTVTDANKGGLIMDWNGIPGFLPASQLKPDHYPRIEDGDKDKILQELKKLVGTKIAVTIIGSDQKEGRIILSEKKIESEELKEIVEKYKVGDIIEGNITGVVDFGIFIKIEEGLEGLAHISELDWTLIENPGDLFKVGEKIKAKIIEIKDGKISLSVKALKPNPWEKAKDKYKKGDIIKGVIIKFNRHGALASIEEGVAGLVHISEFGTEEEMKKKLELGKSYAFQITLFDPKEQKLTLNYAEEGKAITETEQQ